MNEADDTGRDEVRARGAGFGPLGQVGTLRFMNPLRLAGRGLLGLAAGATVVLTAMVAGQPTGPSPLNPPPNGPRRADTT